MISADHRNTITGSRNLSHETAPSRVAASFVPLSALAALLCLLSLALLSCGKESGMGTGVVFPKDAVLRIAAAGFTFTEGPAAAPDGSLYFTCFREGTINRLTEEGRLSTAFTIDCWPVGMCMGQDGLLYVCANKWHRIIAIAPDSTVVSFSDSCEGMRLNSPNDCWVAPDGGVYFTDPRYVPLPEPIEQPGYHVYYLTPDRSQIIRATRDVAMPNGIAGSPDGSRVYVTDTGDNQVFVFSVMPDKTLGGKRLFAPDGRDGLAVDDKGNVYVIVEFGVAVYSPDGREIDRLALKETPTNVVVTGRDRHTLSITGRKNVYQIAIL